MIISKDTDPGRDLYYLGAEIIDCLDRLENSVVDYVLLFDEVRKRVDLSSNLFSLTLSWLFLLDVVELTDEGDIRKCS